MTNRGRSDPLPVAFHRSISPCSPPSRSSRSWRPACSPPPAFAQDPLADLSKNVTAVIDPGPEGKILVVEEAHGASNVRTLAVGDEYPTGWKVDAIAADSVTLKKGAEARTVAILGKDKGPEVADTAPVAAFTTAAPRPPPQRPRNPLQIEGLEAMIAQGNAMFASLSPEERERINRQMAAEADRRAANAPQTLEAAIAARDPEAVSRLGGTMRDFMMASGGVSQEQLDRMPAAMLGGPAPQLPSMPRSIEEAQQLMNQLQSSDLSTLFGLPGVSVGRPGVPGP